MGKTVTVASGQLGEIRWAFGVAGGGGQRCYADISTWPAGDGLWESMGGKLCEEASTRHGEWSQVSGIAFSDKGNIELYQASSRVHFLELLLTDPGGNDYAPEWRRLRTKALTRAERTKAKLGPNYRFAAVASAQAFCVTAVRTFDRDHELLRERSVPCEY